MSLLAGRAGGKPVNSVLIVAIVQNSEVVKLTRPVPRHSAWSSQFIPKNGNSLLVRNYWE